jgi:hypothetical protein
MMWDNWAQQAYNVFKAVLSRPRFRLSLVKEEIVAPGGSTKVMFFRHNVTKDTFSCIVIPGRFHCSVTVQETDGLKIWGRGRFRFSTHFNKANSVPMRREALKAAKKISQKGIYDVMHS